jgi:hypothetical protein
MCHSAFERIDREISIESISKSIEVLKNNINPELPVDTINHKFDYHFQQNRVGEEADNSMLYNMLASERYVFNQVNRRPHKPPAIWIRFLRWFDTNSVPVEFTLKRPQRSSVLSIIITYSWILATILLIYYLGVLSLSSQPIEIYRDFHNDYSY